MPFAGKPILGIVGGIGSGKSHVARVLGELGWLVIHSDDAVHAVYRERDVIGTLVGWYGPSIVDASGAVDRRALAKQVFASDDERKRLEALVHPRVNAARETLMNERASDPLVRGFVWDSPLLIEAGLDRACDEVIFVDTPRDVRLVRVRGSRGWDDAELDRREARQLSLDEKRRRATCVIRGDMPSDELRARLVSLVESPLF